MGDVLARPITEKHPFNEKIVFPEQQLALSVGGSAMQGWRRGMEDAHDVKLNLDPSHANGVWSWFGVFDGHCGKLTAQYAGDNLGSILVTTDEWKAGNITAALRAAFLNCDKVLREDQTPTRDGSGSTAVTCLVGMDTQGRRKVYCANAGDSRAVLCRAGEAVALSTDHKPNLETERARILAAGSFVAVGRVNGNLALSRALGDFDFKANAALPPEQQAVSPEPEVLELDLQPEDEFIVIACDGVWDVLSSQQVVTNVQSELRAGKSLSTICDNVFDSCLSPHAPGLGCDNMTMMIIDLRGAFPSAGGAMFDAPAAATEPTEG